MRDNASMEEDVCFQLIKGKDQDLAVEELEDQGLTFTYVIEDATSGEVLIGGKIQKTPKLTHTKPTSPPQLSWEAEWAEHSPLSHEGQFTLDLSPYGPDPQHLTLEPGPGFGDFSHPTTQLTLAAMAPYIGGATVVDIGCGSGILALSSLKLGARRAYALDIDSQALEHTRKNASINELESQVTIASQIKEPIDPSPLIVMNMILYNQMEAWPVHSQLATPGAQIITSGILKSQTESYLELTAQWGWSLEEQTSLGEWSAFIFNII